MLYNVVCKTRYVLSHLANYLQSKALEPDIKTLTEIVEILRSWFNPAVFGDTSRISVDAKVPLVWEKRIAAMNGTWHKMINFIGI